MPSINLRDGILASPKVCFLSPPAEVLYRRLMSAVDNYGRMSAHPHLIRVKCYPLQVDQVGDEDVREWLNEVCGAGLIALYKVKGERFLEIYNFKQKIRSKSKCPAPKDGVPDEAEAKDGSRPAPRLAVLPKKEEVPAIESQEEWLARLAQLYPDRDVKGELVSFKSYKKKKGEAVNRRGFEGWIRNSSPTIDGRTTSTAGNNSGKDEKAQDLRFL